MNRNGMGSLTIILLGLAIVVVLGLGVAWGNGSLSLDSTGSGGGQYDYTGKNVEVSLQTTNKYTAAAIDPTFYVYEKEPANWDNGRVSVQDGYVSSVSSSSGTATLTEVPGTYFVRAVLSNYYDEFFTVEVPASGDVPLSQWNDGGEAIEKIQLIDIETLSTSNLDMGIVTNESSDKTYTSNFNFNVDDNEGIILEEIKFREDATYSFATDTDGDGVYDEGINKIVFSFQGKDYTLFDVAASIDQFSGDDEAVVELGGVLIEENGVVSGTFKVTCDATLDTTGDADEKCGNGEDFLDSVILVDASGATATFDLIG